MAQRTASRRFNVPLAARHVLCGGGALAPDVAMESTTNCAQKHVVRNFCAQHSIALRSVESGSYIIFNYVGILLGKSILATFRGEFPRRNGPRVTVGGGILRSGATLVHARNAIGRQHLAHLAAVR